MYLFCMFSHHNLKVQIITAEQDTFWHINSLSKNKKSKNVKIQSQDNPHHIGIFMVSISHWVKPFRSITVRFCWNCKKQFKDTDVMDNVSAHNGLSDWQFLARQQVPVLDHVPYSPDPSLWDLPPFLSSNAERDTSAEDTQKEGGLELLKGPP
jgi:hypothetical protein